LQRFQQLLLQEETTHPVFCRVYYTQKVGRLARIVIASGGIPGGSKTTCSFGRLSMRK